MRGAPFFFDDRFKGSRAIAGAAAEPAGALQEIRALRLVQATRPELASASAYLQQAGIPYRTCAELTLCESGWLESVAFIHLNQLVILLANQNSVAAGAKQGYVWSHFEPMVGIGDLTPRQARAGGRSNRPAAPCRRAVARPRARLPPPTLLTAPRRTRLLSGPTSGARGGRGRGRDCGAGVR
jgi:hypothetical protein